VRHGRRAASSLSGRLRRLAHLNLHEQTDIPSNLGQRASQQPARTDQGAKAVAVSVPRSIWAPEAELGGEFSGNNGTLVTKHRQRADRSAKLDHQCLSERVSQASLTSAHGSKPAAAFKPNVIGGPGCRRVRPSMMASLYSSDSSRNAFSHRARSASMSD
jgi:hypothetical protein